ncbi:MAG TPA: GNAT family N-acetyltransferase [Planctomycetaceae bacterium]|nr:GNAT family N-acetyltransferase [Planctomycetaceae bacterium]
MTLQIYEYDPRERDEVLPFRNAIFGHVSVEHWEAMRCTAVVARDDGRLVGFIPLQFRDQLLRPGVAVPVVYENAVGVAEGMRGRGIGSQMMDEAARFIADRVDAMMVIRGGERTQGYRFYRKTGHGDLMYAHSYNLPPEVKWPSAGVEGFTILTREEWVALEPELLSLYEHRYGRFGGNWQRSPGYWSMILAEHVYRERQWDLITWRPDGGRLAGYAVAVHGRASPTPEINLYEVVGEDDAAVEALLHYARRLSENGAVIVPSVSLANPIRPLLRRMGFIEAPSSPYIMARILRPDRIFERLAANSDLLDELHLVVSTPHRTLVVNDPPSPRYTAHLSTKESLLSRLFCCRLDLEAAVDMELVRWNVYDAGLARALADVFAFSEWVQWYTDYV